MGKIYILFLVIFVLNNAKGQDQSIITTSRDIPVGIISYASVVISSGFEVGRYVDGYVKKKGDNKFIFPVGDNGLYRPFAAAADATIGAYYRENPASSTSGNDVTGGPFSNIKAADVGGISSIEFWDINGTNPTALTLTWTAASNIGTLINSSDIGKLIVVGYDGEKWVKIPATVDETALLGGASTITAGSITTNDAFSPDIYRVYTLASIPDVSLPVTLVSFNARLAEKNVALEWVTSEEVNHDRFLVERLGLNNTWEVISVISGNKSVGLQKYSYLDEKPKMGENLYRLRMIDLDESFAFSQIRSVQINSDMNEISLYPNPVSSQLFIKTGVGNPVTEITFYNLMGKAVLNSVKVPVEGINVSQLVSGTYVVTFRTTSGDIISGKVVITH